MTTPPPAPGQGISRLVEDDGQRLLNVSREHAISEAWLLDHEPDLYAAWHAAAGPANRDELARSIEARFDSLEPNVQPGLGRHPAASTAASTAATTTPLPPGTGEDRPGLAELVDLIEDYETRLIGSGGPRASLDEHRSHLEAHIGWHQLDDTGSVIGLRLRDWAEHGAPALLIAWQRDALSGGPAADTRMLAIASARNWAEALIDIDPRLAAPVDLPALAAALDRAAADGYPVTDELPRLVAQADLPDRHPARELHYRLISDCAAAAWPASIIGPAHQAMTASSRDRVDEADGTPRSTQDTSRTGTRPDTHPPAKPTVLPLRSHADPGSIHSRAPRR